MNTTLKEPLAYTIQYPKIVSEIQDSAVLFSRYNSANENPTQAEAKRYTSVWDTGCTGVAITRRIAEELNLEPIAMTQVGTAGGTRDSFVYTLSLWLPNGIYLPKIEVTECTLSGGVDCLIGMEVIKYGDFCISNFDGATTMSFRVPSMAITDYVSLYKKLNPVTHNKIGRNDECPCGSGKKYKNCCGK